MKNLNIANRYPYDEYGKIKSSKYKKILTNGKFNRDHINIRYPRTDALDTDMATGMGGCMLQLLQH